MGAEVAAGVAGVASVNSSRAASDDPTLVDEAHV
jgi:hypothetical protein